MNENEHIDESFEKALQLMEQSDELTEQDIAQLLTDDACMEDAKELWAVKKALDRKNVHLPDVEEEWKRLGIEQSPEINVQRSKLKSQGSRFKIQWFLAAAAAALLLFVFVWNRKGTLEELPDNSTYTAYAASNEPRDIVITTNQGNSIVLNKQDVSTLGSEISQTEELAIAYKQLNENIVESHTATIPEGKTLKINLADGSEVWINAGSRLVYPTRFIGSQREVLLEGEAYFKVARDAAHPFIVKTGDVLTRVLGTEFNIRSNPSDHDVQITLVSGKVAVEKSEKGGEKKALTLTPGQQAVFNAQNSMFNVTEVDTDLYAYWKEGYFFFDDEPLENIMKQIGSWYNVNVVFNTPDSRHYKMHFFCERNSTVEEVINQLNMLQKVHATVSNNTIYID